MSQLTKVSTTGRIRLTLEINWPHTFGEKASAVDIYTTVARECQRSLEKALEDSKISYRIIGEIEPLMVILPVKKP